MRITSKGQVTIPKKVRDRLGFLPQTEISFEIADDTLLIRKASLPLIADFKDDTVLRILRNTADSDLTTDEIMALTRDL